MVISLKGRKNTEFAILPCGSVTSNTGAAVTLATLEAVRSGRAAALSSLSDLEIKMFGPFSPAKCSDEDVKLVKKEIE